MTNQQPARSTTQAKDSLIGICSALGEDFGFNPLWLRLALGALFVLLPIGVVAGYLAFGLAVLVSRLLVPTPKRRLPVARADEPRTVANEATDEMDFAKAA